MASTMIVAVISLAVLASVSAQTFDLYLEGSSAARTLLFANIPAIIAPKTSSYGAHGSGVGKIFVNYTLPINTTLVGANVLTGTPYGSPTPFPRHGVLAFSDEPYPSTAPPGTVQIPVAIGSIAFYVNLGAGYVLPAGVSLSAANLCTIFKGKATTWKALNSMLPKVNVTLVRRTDASGSTDVVQSYLNKVCSPKVTIAPLTPMKVIGATSTSNMLSVIATTAGAIGYAVCGSVDSASPVRFFEMPVQANDVSKTAVLCQTADYSAFTIPNPPGKKWYTVSLTAGTSTGQYPTANILFAFARATVTNTMKDIPPQGYIAKQSLIALTAPSLQQTLTSFAFQPLPDAARVNITCPAINALVTNPVIAAVTCV